MVNNWSSEQIKVKELEEKIMNKKIQVPTYQRGVVWNLKKQKDLIESIKFGYPFGSLIIYDYEDLQKPLLLIDGLQRSTSLFKFINNPSMFFDETDIDDNILDKLTSEISVVGSRVGQKNDIKTLIVNWVKSFRTSTEVQEMNESICARKIMDDFPILKQNKDANEILDVLDKISKIIKPVFDKYKNLCRNIEDKIVPYIKITGDDSNLSEIFFRINDRGVKLNKQNKFAATWTNHSVKITNNKLLKLVELVRDRYDQIQREGTTIYGYDSQEFLSNNDLDIFELTYAFGKYITNLYPELFGNKEDLIAVDSIGFTLLNACLMGTKDSLSKMNELMINTFDNNQINTFLINVLSCIKYVDEILAPVTKFKSNKRIGKSPLHTEFQIVSFISTVFRLKYIQKDDEEYKFDLSCTNNSWNQTDRLIQKHSLKRYIYDIIDNYWDGHGDNSLDIILHENPALYTKDINQTDFKACLYNWFNRQKDGRKESTVKSVKAPGDPEKVLLNLIYSNSFTAATQLNIAKFDIEHLAPRKLMEKRLSKYGQLLKLPISSIGNLCLLPEYTNRKKKDDTIYMDKNYIDKLGNKVSLEDLEKEFTFTNYESLKWLEKENLSILDFENCFIEFITNRFEKILEKVVCILYFMS